VLSEYWFTDDYLAGSFTVRNKRYQTFAHITHLADSSASLTRVRPDDELIVDLGPAINTRTVRDAIDALLRPTTVSRTSGVRVAAVPWRLVPYHDDEPGKHAPNDLLVRVYFEIHIGTPWYVPDADGDVSYYVMFGLDEDGNLYSHVDGWSFSFDGGGL